MILVSIIATIGLMTLFSWSYNRFYVGNTDNQHSKITRKTKIFEFLSLHMIYVINIMTNQGSSLIYFHSFHYHTALGII